MWASLLSKQMNCNTLRGSTAFLVGVYGRAKSRVEPANDHE